MLLLTYRENTRSSRVFAIRINHLGETIFTHIRVSIHLKMSSPLSLGLEFSLRYELGVVVDKKIFGENPLLLRLWQPGRGMRQGLERVQLEIEAKIIGVDKGLEVEILVGRETVVILVKINIVELVYAARYHLQGSLQVLNLSKEIKYVRNM